MERLLTGLATLVARHPGKSLLFVLIPIFIFSGVGQPEQGEDPRLYSPGSDAVSAADDIDAWFSGSARLAPLQILFESDDDLISLAGWEADKIVREIIETTTTETVNMPDLLAPQPGIGAFISVHTLVDMSVNQMGLPEPTDDVAYDAMFKLGRNFAPDASIAQLATLVPKGVDLADATAEKSLMIVFFNAPRTFEEEIALQTVQLQLMKNLEAAELPDGIVASPFSLELVSAVGDDSGTEILTLLGLAILLIFIVLVVIFFPGPPMPLLGRFQRAAMDAFLALLVPILAIGVLNASAYVLQQAGIINTMTGLTQTISILLVGLGVDFVIHINNEYRDRLYRGDEPTVGMVSSITSVGVALFLAMITTAAGFLTNVTAGLPALFDFGILAAIGIIVCFLLSITFFPAARIMLDKRAARKGRLIPQALAIRDTKTLNQIIEKTGVIARRFRPAALLAGVVLTVLGIIGTLSLETKFSFLDFLPNDSPVADVAATLFENFERSASEQTQVLITGDIANGAAFNALVDEVNRLIDAPYVANFDGQPRATSFLNVLSASLDENSETYSEALAEAAAAAGLDDNLIVPSDADLSEVYRILRETNPTVEGLLSVDENAILLSIATNAGEIHANALRNGLDAHFSELEKLVGDVRVTSNEILNQDVVIAIQDIQLSSLAVALLAAAVILMFSFWRSYGRPELGIIAILPVTLVLLLLFGGMALLGIPFGPVTASLSALAIGIGIDYMIHITHRYQHARKHTNNIDEAITEMLSSTGSALAGSAISTAVGFSVLLTSSLTPFRQLSAVTVLAIVLSTVVAVLLLPSLLVTWDIVRNKVSADHKG